MEDANEIQEAMSRSYGTPDIDEDDLEAGRENTNMPGFHIYSIKKKKTLQSRKLQQFWSRHIFAAYVASVWVS